MQYLIDPTYVFTEIIYIYKQDVTHYSIKELMYANLNDPVY